jgi:signal transduction histidine kinase
MSLRFKMFILPVLAVAAAAGFIAWGSEQYARRQFQQADLQRNETLVAQFRGELAQRGDEVVRAVQSVAEAEATLRMALELSQPQADPSLYANDARGLASIHHLDYLDFLAADGALISSAHWPALSGYRNDWVAAGGDWSGQGAFLGRVPLPENVELGLLAVRAVRVGERNMYVVGGLRFDREFLRRLALPEGMRVLLYSNLEPAFVPAALAGPEGPVGEAGPFAPMIESLRRGEEPQPQTIQESGRAGAETFVAVPLPGRDGKLLGALLVGSSQQNLLALVDYIRSLALAAGGAGVLFGLALSWWISARVSRPLARMTAAAREVQSGKLHSGSAWLAIRSRNEAGRLAGALSDMIGHLTRERERVVQSERAAARREMARRLTREIKESLFPLQMTADDMLRAREETSERFDEVFFECTAALRAEFERLKGVAARFSEFAKMPPPRPAPVNVNEVVRTALKSVEPQFSAEGRPPATPEIHLREPEPVIVADAGLLRLAVENLLLHSLDAMPAGGALAIRTGEKNGVVAIEISSTGATLAAEECSRLFMPSVSNPQGTGLGLATAQAVVSDHGGRISAQSAPGAGTTFRLEFAAAPAGVKPPAAPIPQPSPEPQAAEAERPVEEPAAPPAADGN